MITCEEKTVADWKAPAQDGEILLWPDARCLIEQTQDNHRRLAAADPVRLQRIPLPEVRRQGRQWLGHDENAGILVAAGHQIELLHPGVWAKDVLINELAQRMGGSAYHFAVDTDVPKHLQLRWPGTVLPLTDDPNAQTAAWDALIEAPTPAHLKYLETTFQQAQASWPFQSMLGGFLDIMRRLGLESSNLTWVLTNAIHQLDWNLGLRYHAMLASPIWLSPAYLLFVYHVLARADSFAATYNQTLQEYRRENHIRHMGRPWPDLKATAEECEVPFWLDCLDADRRQRAKVVRRGISWHLRLANGAELELDQSADGWTAANHLARFLMAGRVRLSPRALTLTAFFRLAIVDQFVHGIGGARYDEVTDRVIARWFGIEPPRFSVTTATLWFPTALNHRRIDVHPLLVEGRRIRHNWLGEEKLRMVRRIASLPRKSEERRQLFYQMHKQLAAVVDKPVYLDWEHRLDDSWRMARQQQEIFDRELFYAIQPEPRLRELISQYRDCLR
ncbi:MAG: hypothetical protein ACM359_06300 [Bacillota bacterium]